MNAIGRRLALAEILSSLILHLTPILGPFADMEVCVCVCVCVCGFSRFRPPMSLCTHVLVHDTPSSQGGIYFGSCTCIM